MTRKRGANGRFAHHEEGCDCEECTDDAGTFSVVAPEQYRRGTPRKEDDRRGQGGRDNRRSGNMPGQKRLKDAGEDAATPEELAALRTQVIGGGNNAPIKAQPAATEQKEPCPTCGRLKPVEVSQRRGTEVIVTHPAICWDCFTGPYHTSYTDALAALKKDPRNAPDPMKPLAWAIDYARGHIGDLEANAIDAECAHARIEEAEVTSVLRQRGYLGDDGQFLPQHRPYGSPGKERQRSLREQPLVKNAWVARLRAQGQLEACKKLLAEHGDAVNAAETNDEPATNNSPADNSEPAES